MSECTDMDNRNVLSMKSDHLPKYRSAYLNEINNERKRKNHTNHNESYLTAE